MLDCLHEYLTYLPFIPIPAVLGYPILVKLLRNRRTQKLQKSLGYDDGDTAAKIYERISLSDAQAIMLNMSQLEFPRFFEIALQFALFRVCPTPPVCDGYSNLRLKLFRLTPFPPSLPSSPKLASCQRQKVVRNAMSTPQSLSPNSRAGRWTQSGPLSHSLVSPRILPLSL